MGLSGGVTGAIPPHGPKNTSGFDLTSTKANLAVFGQAQGRGGGGQGFVNVGPRPSSHVCGETRKNKRARSWDFH